MDGEITWSGGGVGRNIADALSKLGVRTHFVSAIGKDHFGDFLNKETLGHVETKTFVTGNERTPMCLVLCDKEGNSRLLVGDMKAHKLIDTHALQGCQQQIFNSSLVVIDGNVPLESISNIFQMCSQHNIPVFFEPTDISTARGPFQVKTNVNRPISFISPNVEEFAEIVNEIIPNFGLKKDDSLSVIATAACQVVENFVDNVLVTLGANGVLIARRGTGTDPLFSNKGRPELISYDLPVTYRVYTPPPFPASKIVNVSGAGDCFASGFIVSMLRGLRENDCVTKGFQASQAALKSSKTVPDNLLLE